MQIGDRRTDSEGTVWEVSSISGASYTENIITLGQAAIDRQAADAAAKAAQVAAEQEKLNSRYKYENQYVLLCRSIGLADKAGTDEIQAYLENLKGDGTNIPNAFQAMNLGMQFLALINAIGQNGGNWDDIQYREGY